MHVIDQKKVGPQHYFKEDFSENGKRPWFGNMSTNLENDFSFAVVGDRCGITTPGIFEKGLQVVKGLNPDFVLSVGDFIEGYWDQEEAAHGEWDYIDQLIKDVDIPFYLTVGNHDYGNDTMVKVWRERKGFEYYAFRLNDYLFLVMNTEENPIGMPEAFVKSFREITNQVVENPTKARGYIEEFFGQMTEGASEEDIEKGNLPHISDEQLQFFADVLHENHDVQHTFVFMHKPAWKTKDLKFSQFENMLESRPYTMFAGHLHQLEVTKKNNRNYIQMGRTGACWHGDSVGSIDHILLVTVKNGEVGFQVIELDGVSDLEKYKVNT
ncbi:MULTISPECIES: metallophosphoesterase family protein [Cytobacillus]|uniref:Metallophosphoesterase n=1 Tax=Cytobacillus stercorigallinarum TaxID=2762240 RepID=A0ABR8QNI9_9BACI|nr:metallophosphoesterase [Cytobacillus stercorigallinarum]MBD7937093.1 metallophosphoesterase [Cytobacillus stercorigallinarum]